LLGLPRHKDLEASISILGERGTIIVEGASANKLTTWTFDDNADLSEFCEEPPNVYGFGHNQIIDNVVDTLTKEAKPLVGGEEAMKSIGLLHALYSSMEADGKEVRLRDNPVSKKFGVIDKKIEPVVNLYRTPSILKEMIR